MVKISNGARVLYQWERGVKLTVTGQCDIVRMSREDDSSARDCVPYKNGAEKEVEVPDFLLTESGYLRVSIIIRENDTERILETARFVIRPMQKSNNRAMSERDVGSWLVLKMRMDALERAAREGKFNGDDGITPHIGENGNWYLADFDTGIQAQGEDGITPHIGENGNWYLGDIDTGVKAKNEDVSLYADDLYTSGVLVTDDLDSFVMTGGVREDGKPQIVTSPGVAYIKGVRRWLNTSRRTYDVRDTDRVQAQYLRLNEATGEIGLAIWHDVTINGDLDSGCEIVDEFTGEVIPKRSGGYYDVILCIATIPAGATEVTPDMIRDLRGDERYCGFVRSKVDGGATGGGLNITDDGAGNVTITTGSGGGTGGLNTEAANLLIEILRKATYTEDVSGQIGRLEEILLGNSGGDTDSGLIITDEGNGNVTITAYGNAIIIDDGNGNVTIPMSDGVTFTDDGNGNVIIA